MSKLLNDIASNSVSLSVCLQRLLIIANKTNNPELSEWCIKELNGYKSKDNIPDYRHFKSLNIVYSGVNGRFQLTNQPLQPGYLSSKTLESIENVKLFENITECEKRMNSEDSLSRDLTFLSGEVYKNTLNKAYGIGVQCTSIRQVIPQQFYGEIHSAVKTRIINLLCYYEKKNVDIDNLDIRYKKESDEENNKLFNKVVIDGEVLLPQKIGKKITWNIIIPIISAVVSGVISGVLVYLITNVWSK